VAQPNGYQQMINAYQEFRGSILPCIKLIQDDEYDRYGIIAGSEVKKGVLKAESIVEKPGKQHAPSDFGSIGAFLLEPAALNFLEAGQKQVRQDDEFYLSTYVIEPMIEAGYAFYACVPDNARRYDTGNKLEYLKTVVDFALMHEDLRDDFKEYLKQMV
jgi:UTP--glucose-1-phosphate uridylyltransferase